MFPDLNQVANRMQSHFRSVQFEDAGQIMPSDRWFAPTLGRRLTPDEQAAFAMFMGIPGSMAIRGGGYSRAAAQPIPQSGYRR